jgi:hypothetical protein
MRRLPTPAFPTRIHFQGITHRKFNWHRDARRSPPSTPQRRLNNGFSRPISIPAIGVGLESPTKIRTAPGTGRQVSARASHGSQHQLQTITGAERDSVHLPIPYGDQEMVRCVLQLLR